MRLLKEIIADTYDGKTCSAEELRYALVAMNSLYLLNHSTAQSMQDHMDGLNTDDRSNLTMTLSMFNKEIIRRNNLVMETDPKKYFARDLDDPEFQTHREKIMKALY